MQARLTKSRTARVIDGVCGGLAAYFGIDPVIVRLVFVVLALINGVGVLAYILLMIVLPRSDQTEMPPADVARQNVQELGSRGASTLRRTDRGVLAGVILVLLGLAFLLDNMRLFWWLRLDVLWPLVLIGIGVLLLVGQFGRSSRTSQPGAGADRLLQQAPAVTIPQEAEPTGQPGAGSITVK
jgi:phage shock protein PspC (stress-responsive transcriptional regulator)